MAVKKKQSNSISAVVQPKAVPVPKISEDWEVTEVDGDYLCNNVATNQFFRTAVSADIPAVISALSEV